MPACLWQVFIMDKKKARTFGGVEPFNRIRKELVKEVRPGTLDHPPNNKQRKQQDRLCTKPGHMHMQCTHPNKHVLACKPCGALQLCWP